MDKCVCPISTDPQLFSAPFIVITAPSLSFRAGNVELNTTTASLASPRRVEFGPDASVALCVCDLQSC